MRRVAASRPAVADVGGSRRAAALLPQALRFGLVGAVNSGLGLAAIYALMFFGGVAPAAANLGGYALGMAVGFWLNRSWTFASRRPVRDLLPPYLLVLGLAYVINLATVVAGISRLGWNAYLAQLAGIAMYACCSFVGCRWIVFADRR
jgi:putative flippase GtrA